MHLNSLRVKKYLKISIQSSYHIIPAHFLFCTWSLYLTVWDTINLITCSCTQSLIHAQRHNYTFTCTNTQQHLHVYMYAQAQAHAYTHTHAHTHTHTHSQVYLKDGCLWISDEILHCSGTDHQKLINKTNRSIKDLPQMVALLQGSSACQTCSLSSTVLNYNDHQHSHKCHNHAKI